MNVQQMSGPEWLEEMAERSEGGGQRIEADQYRQRAAEWRAEQEQHAVMPVEVGELPSFTAVPIRYDLANNELVLSPTMTLPMHRGTWELRPLPATAR